MITLVLWHKCLIHEGTTTEKLGLSDNQVMFQEASLPFCLPLDIFTSLNISDTFSALTGGVWAYRSSFKSVLTTVTDIAWHTIRMALKNKTNSTRTYKVQSNWDFNILLMGL